MATMTQAPPTTVREKVQQVINLIRPAVQADGGDIELVDVTPDGIDPVSRGLSWMPKRHDDFADGDREKSAREGAGSEASDPGHVRWEDGPKRTREVDERSARRGAGGDG